MLRRHAENQKQRSAQLGAMKAKAEEQRDEIFRRLCEEEAERRAKAEYLENLRNELSAHDAETRAKDQELREQAKKERQKAELQAAAEYDIKVKSAR